MLFNITNQKLYINKPEKKQTKSGKQYYTWYTSLGKDKGTITCKCWRLTYDLTKIYSLDKAVVDLIAWKGSNGAIKYELVVKDFAEPKMRDYRIDNTIPVKKEIKPMEPLGEKILEEPEMVDIDEALPPLEEIKLGELK